MGEIAEAMLDGTLCQFCGEYLENGSPGYPRTCAGCKEAEKQDLEREKRKNDRTRSRRDNKRRR